MKTNKPNHINYTAQYQLMRLAHAVMPLMPEAIVDRFSAHASARMMHAEEQPHLYHPDRFDLLVDWGCTAHTIVRNKIAR